MQFADIILQRLFFALAVAVLAGGAVRLARKVEDRYWEWRYPLAAEYLSWFDGWDSTTDGPTRIALYWRQFGRSLKGKTRLVDGSMQWTQDAEIRNGKVVGTHSSDNPHNEDTGIYFLEVKRDGRLVGYWAGQEANGSTAVQTGRFELVPRQDDMRTTSVDRDDLPVAMTINDWRRSIAAPAETIRAAVSGEEEADDASGWVSVLGYREPSSPGLLQRSLERLFDIQSPEVTRVFKNQQQRQKRVYTGLVVASIRTPSAAADRLGVDRQSLPDSMNHAPTVGLVELMSLNEDAHNQAVVLELLERALEQCLAGGAAVVCLPVEDEDEVLEDAIARLDLEPVGNIRSPAPARSDGDDRPTAVVGDGGESNGTTLYLWFE